MDAYQEGELSRREWETERKRIRYDTHGDIRTAEDWAKELEYWKQKKQEDGK